MGWGDGDGSVPRLKDIRLTDHFHDPGRIINGRNTEYVIDSRRECVRYDSRDR